MAQKSWRSNQSSDEYFLKAKNLASGQDLSLN